MNGGVGQSARVLKNVLGNDPAFGTRDELARWASQRARDAQTASDQLLALEDIRRATAAHAHLLDDNPDQPPPLPIEQQAALVIESLMRDLLVVDHVVFVRGRTVTARKVLRMLAERLDGAA